MYYKIDEEQAIALLSDLIELNTQIDLDESQYDWAKEELIGVEMQDGEGLHLIAYTQTNKGETIYQLRIGGNYGMRHVCYL